MPIFLRLGFPPPTYIVHQAEEEEEWSLSEKVSFDAAGHRGLKLKNRVLVLNEPGESSGLVRWFL